MVKDPMALYNAVPQATPLAENAFSPIIGKEGYYQIHNPEALRALPKFAWSQLYNLPGVQERVDAMADKKSKKKKKAAISDEPWVPASNVAWVPAEPPSFPLASPPQQVAFEDMEIYEC